MLKKILKFFGLATYRELISSRRTISHLLDRIELGVEFHVLKENEHIKFENLNKDLIIRYPNNQVIGNHIKGSVFINGKPFGDPRNLIFKNNIIEGMNHELKEVNIK